MKRRTSPSLRLSTKGRSLILILCALGAILFLLTVGQSPRSLAQATIVTITPSVTPDEAEAVPNPQTEIDLSNGIILAGALLIVVIILGTLHATWGLRKPPHSH